MCTHTCTRLTLPSCRFQENNMRQIEGNLDTLCEFVQCCNQKPLLCQPRSKVRGPRGAPTGRGMFALCP